MPDLTCYNCRARVGTIHDEHCPRSSNGGSDLVRLVDVQKPPYELKWSGDPKCEPTKAYPGDVGFDLYVSEFTRVHVGQSLDVPLGIRVELPPGVWALITGRSSTLRRRGLLVINGVIDNGFRGDMFAYVHNLSDQVVEIQRGERIAQLIPHLQVEPRVVQVAELSGSHRGEGMFGSSGA